MMMMNDDTRFLQLRLSELQKQGLEMLARARQESQQTVMRDLLVRELIAEGMYPRRAVDVLEKIEEL